MCTIQIPDYNFSISSELVQPGQAISVFCPERPRAHLQRRDYSTLDTG